MNSWNREGHFFALNGMECPTAKTLFEDYNRAAVAYFEATDALAGLVGQHNEFAVAKRHTEQTQHECRAACVALEKHRAEHNCGRIDNA